MNALCFMTTENEKKKKIKKPFFMEILKGGRYFNTS